MFLTALKMVQTMNRSGGFIRKFASEGLFPVVALVVFFKGDNHFPRLEYPEEETCLAGQRYQWGYQQDFRLDPKHPSYVSCAPAAGVTLNTVY